MLIKDILGMRLRIIIFLLNPFLSFQFSIMSVYYCLIIREKSLKMLLMN